MKQEHAGAFAPDLFEPPAEYSAARWHFVGTEYGVMCASWWPSIDGCDCGSWDISGHCTRADDLHARKAWDYLGPVPMPPKEKP